MACQRCTKPCSGNSGCSAGSSGVDDRRVGIGQVRISPREMSKVRSLPSTNNLELGNIPLPFLASRPNPSRRQLSDLGRTHLPATKRTLHAEADQPCGGQGFLSGPSKQTGPSVKQTSVSESPFSTHPCKRIQRWPAAGSDSRGENQPCTEMGMQSVVRPQQLRTWKEETVRLGGRAYLGEAGCVRSRASGGTAVVVVLTRWRGGFSTFVACPGSSTAAKRPSRAIGLIPSPRRLLNKSGRAWEKKLRCLACPFAKPWINCCAACVADSHLAVSTSFRALYVLYSTYRYARWPGWKYPTRSAGSSQ